MKVAIIGTGLMGKGLVQIFAQCSEITLVYWVGRCKKKLEDGLLALLLVWQKLLAKGKIAESEMVAFKSKIVLLTEAGEICDSDLIVEAVQECLLTKKEVIEKISGHVKETTLVATNSSSLSITELARSSKYPENVVGMHFFNPPAVMKLVEIVVGLQTSEKTVCRAKEISSMLGKQPILVKEAPGFIVNRMLIPMINEAVGLLAENVAEAAEIDMAMIHGANHPIGPLALADLIGNDVVLAIMETLKSETGDPKYRAHPLLRKMVRAQLLGRKTGRGFFDYPAL